MNYWMKPIWVLFHSRSLWGGYVKKMYCTVLVSGCQILPWLAWNLYLIHQVMKLLIGHLSVEGACKLIGISAPMQVSLVPLGNPPPVQTIVHNTNLTQTNKWASKTFHLSLGGRRRPFSCGSEFLWVLVCLLTTNCFLPNLSFFLAFPWTFKC